jgi:hypothetical protein
MYTAIFQSLGYKLVPLCTSADGQMFIDTLVDSEPVEKKQADTKTADFEMGVITSNVTSKLVNSGSSVEIVRDPDDKKNNKVLEFISEGNCKEGDYLYFDAYSRGSQTSGNIFEADFYISTESDANYLFEIMVGKGYMLEMKLVISDDEDPYVIINDRAKVGSQTIRNEIARVSADEWHRIRVELYKAGVPENEIDLPKIKLWVDGEYLGVSENCYFYSNGQSSDAYGNVSIYSLKTPYTVAYFDNVFCSTEEKIYNPNDPTVSDFRDTLV